MHIQSLFPHREVCTYPAVERHSLLRQCNLSRESISSVLSLWTQAIISNMSCIFTTVTEMMLEAGKPILSCVPDYSYSLPFLDTSILISPCPPTGYCSLLLSSSELELSTGSNSTRGMLMMMGAGGSSRHRDTKTVKIVSSVLSCALKRDAHQRLLERCPRRSWRWRWVARPEGCGSWLPRAGRRRAWR